MAAKIIVEDQFIYDQTWDWRYVLRTRDARFWVNSYLVYASSNRDGYYFMRVTYNDTTIVEFREYVGLIGQTPFYGWVSKRLRQFGIKQDTFSRMKKRRDDLSCLELRRPQL